MHVTRVPSIFLSRFPKHASLALAHPLLAVYSPFFASQDFRSLHIFVRRGKNYAEVEVKGRASVAALQKAVAVELKLDVPPDCVRLLREVEDGGMPIPLDSRKKLADQGVKEGCSLLVEEILSAPSSLLSPPLSMAEDPLMTPFLEYRGLERNAELSVFARAVSAAQPGPLCASSGTRPWRLFDPRDPSKPLKWPFLNMHVLLERNFYVRLLNEGQWLDGLTGTQRRLAVLGQPGIGKSAFGLWLLAHLIRTNRTVVYSRNFSMFGSLPDVKHVIFHRGVAFNTASADLGPANSLLSDPSVVHLCDSIKPSGAALCHKVLITSPDPPGVWRWFVEKEYAGTAYFPLHSFPELQALCDSEFGDALSTQTMDLRILAWGLNARSVLSPNQREVWKSVVKAINGLGLEDLQRYMGAGRTPTGAAASEMPHSLFALQADRETLSEGEVMFRSEAVARRVVRQLALRSRDTLIPALQSLLASSSTRSVAGTVFELAAFDTLGRCEFTVRSLGTDKLSPMHGGVERGVTSLPAPWQKRPCGALSRPVHRFDTLAELRRQCTEGTVDLRTDFFKPTSPNLAAIDFIGPGLLLYQVTVNRRAHGLKVTSGRSDGERLLALYTTLLPLLPERWGALQPHLDVCFVVPEGCAQGWGAQKLVLHTPKATTTRKRLQASAPATGGPMHAVSLVQCEGGSSGFCIDGRVVEVRQYVMELPLKTIEEWLALPEQEGDVIDEAAES